LFIEKEKLSKKLAIYYWLSFLITVTAIFLTFSRGGLIALLSGIFVLFLYNYKKLLKAILIMFIIFLILFIIVPQENSAIWFAHKFLNPDAFGRIIIWKTCLSGFISRPITGWGAGSLKEAYHLFSVPVEWEIGRFSKYTRFAHNEYIDIATETGIIGLALFLWFVILTVRTIKDKISLSVVISILIHSFFDFNLHLPAIFFTFFFITGISIREKTYLNLGHFTKKICYVLSVVFLLANISLFTSQIMFNLGEKEKSKNKLKEAMKYYNLSIICNPLNFLAWQKKANLIDNLYEAENSFKKALFLNPNDSFINYDFAHFYIKNNKIEDAIYQYNSAIKKNPHNPFFWFELGEIYLKKNEIQKARLHYYKAVNLEPFYLFAHYRLSQLGNKYSIENIKKILNSNITPTDEYSKRLLYLPEKIKKEFMK